MGSLLLLVACGQTPACPDVSFYPGSLEVETELDARTFCSLYDMVGEHLSVSGTDLADLDALGCLRCVGGNVTIARNDALTSLAGLDALVHVGGDLNVRENANLVSLEGVESLAGVSGGIWVDDNAALTSLDGLEGLDSGGTFSPSLSVMDNPLLTDIGVLSEIQITRDWIRFWDNTALTTLDGLGSLHEAEGGLTVWGSPALTDLGGLSRLERAQGLMIVGNTGLRDLSGLDSLTTVDGTFSLADNGLDTLAGAPLLAEVQALELSDPTLTALTGLSPLALTDRLFLSDVPLLADLAGAASVTLPDGADLLVKDAAALGSLAGLVVPATIGNLVLQDAALADLSALAPVRRIEGQLWIVRIDGLTDLSALHDVEYVRGRVMITGNTDLPQAEVDALLAAIGEAYIGGDVHAEDNGP